jgi:hypothetical protein
MPERALQLTFVICTRNDGYMGNPMWRLQTSLNYLAAQVAGLGRMAEVDVIVTDWGSKSPVHEVLKLSPAAAEFTSFLVVPPETAAACNQDSPFAEVFAINAAVRRARGRYVARIDQDTLVTAEFLTNFFAHVASATASANAETDPMGLMFSARRQVPYFVSRNESPMATIAAIIRTWQGVAVPEEANPFYNSPVGVILCHRRLWHEARGYDERLIYYWYMDLDFAKRIHLRHPLFNFGERFGYDVFHLEHFPLWHWRGTHRQLNPESTRVAPATEIAVNSSDWGLAEHPFEFVRATASSSAGALDQNTGQLHRGQLVYWRSGAWMWMHRLRLALARLARRLRPR